MGIAYQQKLSNTRRNDGSLWKIDPGRNCIVFSHRASRRFLPLISKRLMKRRDRLVSSALR